MQTDRGACFLLIEGYGRGKCVLLADAPLLHYTYLMHELGLMTGVMGVVTQAAEEAGAVRVTDISLSVGEMTEAIEDALVFAFEALSEGTICEGAALHVNMGKPASRCLECGAEYEHDRFHMTCPTCESPFTELIAGKEMKIDSIEVDLPD